MDAPRRRLRRLVASRTGILALDTAPATLAGRLLAAAVHPSPEGTERYLAMLLGTPELAASAGGVVLAPAAFERPAADGRTWPAALAASGMLPGVRADTGSEPLSADGRDQVTSGLDGLAVRLRRLRDLGAGFAVWSTVAGATTHPGAMRVLTANSQAAARFAYLCQDLGVVPVVRVGTRVGGVAAGPRRSATVAAALLSVCGHLQDLDVDLGGVVISTPAEHPVGTGPLATLPAGLGGVALPGGWHSVAAAADAVAAVCASAPPWPVTFHLGREVTQPALQAWHGRAGSVHAGQHALRAGLAAMSAALDRGRPVLFAVPGP